MKKHASKSKVPADIRILFAMLGSLFLLEVLTWILLTLFR
jgi:hypothetical protein